MAAQEEIAKIKEDSIPEDKKSNQVWFENILT